MRLRAPHRVTASGDDGFSLVEAVVALTVATVIFTALAMALVGGAKSALLSQQNQQAGDVLNQAVEQARALPYEALAMRASDLNVGETTGPTRTPTLSALFYNPTNDSTSGPGLEALVTPDPNGKLSPHVTQKLENGGTFTVRRYVTVPIDAAGAVYKRLTVVVDWTTLGKKRTRTYSTLIAASKRGLPLPDFKFTNAATLGQCRNPGSVATYTFNLKNNGARDGWNLSTTPTSPAWSYFADSNSNGTYDAGTDAALAVSAGVPTTGLIEPTTARTFFAVLQLDVAAVRPAPYTLTTTFRATSAAQPSYFQEMSATTAVQAGPCGATTPSPTATPSPSPTVAPPAAPTQPAASCAALSPAASTNAPGGTMVRYYPGNPGQPGNTTAGSDMPMIRDGGTAPAAGNLYNYSTDLHSQAGRYLGAGVSTAAVDVATWTYGMPAASTLKGFGEVTLWAGPAGGSLTARPAFAVTVDLLSSTGAFIRTMTTGTYTTPSDWNCAGLRPLPIDLASITGTGEAVAANQKIRLSVRVTNGVPVRLGYGTGAYPMTMTLPFESGLG